MARFPVIESPCPIAGKDLPQGRTEHCALCDRSVHNLSAMSQTEREVFMRSCSGKVCVAYTIRVNKITRRPAMTAAALAAMAVMSLPLAAEDLPSSPVPGAEEKLPDCDEIEDVVLTGGVEQGDAAEWIDAEAAEQADEPMPEIVEDGR